MIAATRLYTAFILKVRPFRGRYMVYAKDHNPRFFENTVALKKILLGAGYTKKATKDNITYYIKVR